MKYLAQCISYKGTPEHLIVFADSVEAARLILEDDGYEVTGIFRLD